MIAFENKIPDIYHLLCPFGGCWTGITLVKGDGTNYLIDCGGSSECVDRYLVPALDDIGLTVSDIDYLCITHTHADHIGGVGRIKELCPSIKYVVSEKSADKVRDPLKYNKLIRARFPEHSPAPSAGLCGCEPDIIIPDGYTLGSEMQFVFTPGHDTDSGAWLHIPTRTLICGDSLQSNGTDVQGIGLYMDLPAYRRSLAALQGMSIKNILCGHHFLPLGYEAFGEHAVKEYLDSCASLVDKYADFVKRKHGEGADSTEIAKALIKEVDGIEPQYLFLPLYTVTEHLKELKNNWNYKNTTEDKPMSKNVLITGSSNGIGAAAAIAFAKEGYNVGVTYNTNPDGAEKIARKCESYGVETIVLGGNVGEHDVCKKMMEDFLAKFGTIDVLINNAGGALKMPLGGFEKMPMEYWDSQVNLNLNSAAYLSHYAMKNMIENNIQGSIINVSSVHGTIPWVRRKTLPYAAAKAGLNMFTKNLGIEAIHYGINVNGIAPGFITTKATDRYDESDLRDGFLRKIPAGFLGNVDDITPMMLFLADKTKSRFIVGQTFIIDGGQTSDGCVDKMLDDGNPVNAYDIKPDVSKAIKPSLEELAEMTLNK